MFIKRINYSKKVLFGIYKTLDCHAINTIISPKKIISLYSSMYMVERTL